MTKMPDRLTDSQPTSRSVRGQVGTNGVGAGLGWAGLGEMVSGAAIGRRATGPRRPGRRGASPRAAASRLDRHVVFREAVPERLQTRLCRGARDPGRMMGSATPTVPMSTNTSTSVDPCPTRPTVSATAAMRTSLRVERRLEGTHGERAVRGHPVEPAQPGRGRRRGPRGAGPFPREQDEHEATQDAHDRQPARCGRGTHAEQSCEQQQGHGRDDEAEQPARDERARVRGGMRRLREHDHRDDGHGARRDPDGERQDEADGPHAASAAQPGSAQASSVDREAAAGSGSRSMSRSATTGGNRVADGSSRPASTAASMAALRDDTPSLA